MGLLHVEFTRTVDNCLDRYMLPLGGRHAQPASSRQLEPPCSPGVASSPALRISVRNMWQLYAKS